MIGNNRIGCNGRLGNQMFQYASMRGIAAVKGFDWVVPPENYDHTANYALFETFKMTNVQEKNIGFVDGEILKETIHCYDKNLVDSFNLFKFDKIFQVILKSATYEILYKPNVSIRIIIKEYLDASNLFLNDSQTKYLNALLDNAAKKLRSTNA